MERSKYFTAAIASSLGGLALLALGCIFCCGGCLPGGVQPQPQPRQGDVEPIVVDDLVVDDLVVDDLVVDDLEPVQPRKR
jgi:hypothetical protein